MTGTAPWSSVDVVCQADVLSFVATATEKRSLDLTSGFVASDRDMTSVCRSRPLPRTAQLRETGQQVTDVPC